MTNKEHMRLALSIAAILLVLMSFLQSMENRNLRRSLREADHAMVESAKALQGLLESDRQLKASCEAIDREAKGVIAQNARAMLLVRQASQVCQTRLSAH